MTKKQVSEDYRIYIYSGYATLRKTSPRTKLHKFSDLDKARETAQWFANKSQRQVVILQYATESSTISSSKIEELVEPESSTAIRRKF